MRFIKNKKYLSVLLMVIMLILTACSMEDGINGKDNSTGATAEGNLEMYFLDVGQADSTLLISEDEAVLIDAGNRDDADLIESYLENLSIDDLKYVVFTHPHEDHIGSGEAVIDSLEVEKIFMMDGYDEGIEGRLKSAIDKKQIKTEMPEPGDTATFGECTMTFLGPDIEYGDTNDDSICLKITHGENSMMFTGDAGREPERDMIDAGFDLEADLLQAGHHGSSTSNSYYFLREVNPEYVVISCGENNMYGHPHEEALSRFNDLGAEVFRTDLQGTLVATSDGERITFNCEGKKADRPHVEEHEDANYIGNVNSKKYHSPDCGNLPKEENRVYFMSTEAAEKSGYTPCSNCDPQ